MYKKGRNPNEGSRYQKYNRLKQELQRQNEALLRERQNLGGKTNEHYQVPSQYTILQNNDEDQYSQEIQINKGYLNSNYNPQEPPSFQPHHRYKSSRRNSPQKSNQKTKKYKDVVMSDNVIQIIQDIQRKACNQIENLREDKIHLMKKLNQQIRIHNAQKRKRIKLQNKLQSLVSQRSKNEHRNQSYRNPIGFQQEQQEESYERPVSQSHQPKFGQKYNIHQKPNIPQKHMIQQSQQTQNQGQIPENQHYDDRPHTRPNFESQQNINQNSGQSVRRPQNINANINPNIPQSQSMYYVDNNKQRMQNMGHQNRAPSHINRLKSQNMQMRSTHSRNNSNNTVIKNKLQNQLRDLSAKANYYEQMIKQKAAMNSGLQTSHIDNLMAQGNYIAEQGRRLLKAKSNPDFRSATQLLNLSANYQNNENSKFRVSKPQIEEEQAYNLMNYEGKQKDSSNFGRGALGQYQRFLSSMSAAIYS